jgi:hypothetical protein
VKPSQLAYEAAEIMSARGHCKNTLEDTAGHVCYHGALNIAMYGESAYKMVRFINPDLLEVDRAAREVLAERAGPPSLWTDDAMHPVSYNNREDVSGEDVIQLLKEAGSRLEAMGS